MDFQKKDWQFRDLITEDELNRMEDGIEEGITKAEQAQDDISAHVARADNPHGVTKDQVGLGNVDNVQQIPMSQKGQPNGVATLDSTGKVPSSQLPDIAAPVTSVNGKTGDVILTATDVGAETPSGAQSKVDAHASRTDNPHGVTKAQVGLGNVQNYGIATQEQAQAGTANNVYMTPLRTKQAIDTLTGGIPLRLNNGVLEYNDGTGWKAVSGNTQSMQVFKSNGTFVVPDNVHGVYITACGGGGGGATGGGGGGACVLHQFFPVTPGQSLSITVGSGGAGAASNSTGGAGGATVIGSLITLPGGGGGRSNGAGLAGGVGGGNGGYGTSGSGSGLGGYGGERGGSSSGGRGGQPVIGAYSTGGAGNNGTNSTGGAGSYGAGGGGTYGGGGGSYGGGGGGTTEGSGSYGGNGGPGIVIIEW